VSLLMIVIASTTMLAVLAARETAPKVATKQPTFRVIIPDGDSRRLAACRQSRTDF